MDETPILRPVLVCEKVIFERETNNVSLINCHSIRRVESFPSSPISFTVYGVLTNGIGSFTIELRITRLDSGEAIFDRFFPVVFRDPLRTMDLACRIVDLVFPVEGRYEITFYANEEPLGTSVLDLIPR